MGNLNFKEQQATFQAPQAPGHLGVLPNVGCMAKSEHRKSKLLNPLEPLQRKLSLIRKLSSELALEDEKIQDTEIKHQSQFVVFA